jgi:hypothetical protein
MDKKLLDRLHKLEHRTGDLRDFHGVPTADIIRRIVPCRDGGVSRLRSGDDLWTRQLGETERAFFDRASAEVARNGWGFARLIGDDQG